jgi:hypothetical protein
MSSQKTTIGIAIGKVRAWHRAGEERARLLLQNVAIVGETAAVATQRSHRLDQIQSSQIMS